MGKLETKLASLVSMLNRSSDWVSVPEVVMLTFIEAVDLMREQNRELEELKDELKSLRKGGDVSREADTSALTVASQGGTVAASARELSLEKKENILETLSSLQHHHHNRHRRNNTHGAAISVHNREKEAAQDGIAISPPAQGQEIPKKKKRVGMGGVSFAPPPSEVEPETEPELEAKAAQDDSATSSPTSQGQEIPKKKKRVCMGGVSFAPEPPEVQGEPEEAGAGPEPTQEAEAEPSIRSSDPSPGGHERDDSSDSVIRIASDGDIQGGGSSDDDGAPGHARDDSCDSVIRTGDTEPGAMVGIGRGVEAAATEALAEEESIEASPAPASRDMMMGHERRQSSVKELADLIESKARGMPPPSPSPPGLSTGKKGVHFAADEDVNVFKLKLDETFTVHTALKQLADEDRGGDGGDGSGSGSGSGSSEEEGLDEDQKKRKKSKKKKTGKELVFVFEHDDGSVSYGDTKGNNVLSPRDSPLRPASPDAAGDGAEEAGENPKQHGRNGTIVIFDRNAKKGQAGARDGQKVGAGVGPGAAAADLKQYWQQRRRSSEEEDLAREAAEAATVGAATNTTASAAAAASPSPSSSWPAEDSAVKSTALKKKKRLLKVFYRRRGSRDEHGTLDGSEESGGGRGGVVTPEVAALIDALAET